MIIVVDFGSQTAHLISRRIKEIGGESLVVNPAEAMEKIKKSSPAGIILSGGPSSVYEKNAPSIDKDIFLLGVPVLGICYGMQLMSSILGGEVKPGKKEYGPTVLQLKSQASNGQETPSPINSDFKIAKELPEKFSVWMSHGDEVVRLPSGFEVVASTPGLPFGFVAHQKRRLYGIQFHPEVQHTQYGGQILKNFMDLCDMDRTARLSKIKDIEGIIEDIKKIAEDEYVIGAVSGGVDSTVAATLATRALGKKFIPVFVDNGLMREGTREHVEEIFKKHATRPVIIESQNEILKRLKGIEEPEKKRKIIGAHYIDEFEGEVKRLEKKGIKAGFLLQGTIYSDVIESRGSTHASNIKSHHNVGGLPSKMKLKLLEPLRSFYKDEVREVGLMLGLPRELVFRQPFPGPGYAVRIRGEVTKERLEMEKTADRIVLEELDKAGLLDKIFISFPIMTGAYSTAVKGDARLFGEVVAVRIVTSEDVMTADWAKIPYETLQKISSRIVNEVPKISRVVYDITTKPPATMEWE